LQNVYAWRDEELPSILRVLLAAFGGILGRARDEVSHPEKIICRPVFSMICRRLGKARHAAEMVWPGASKTRRVALGKARENVVPC
jgi:hypothetical protein